MTDLQRLIERHEGRRTHPYLDCCGQPWRACACAVKGNLTVGIGRNLDAVPFTEDELLMMLNLDLVRAITAARRLCSVYDRLTVARQHVLISMAFNLGETRLAKFSRFLSAVHLEDWSGAADEMLDSRWAKQVGDRPGQRADELAQMMRTGSAEWV